MRKSILTGTLALSAFATVSAFADIEPRGMPVILSVKDVFIPNGFDDNDEVELMVDGYLPSTCYRLSKTEVRVDPETKIVKIVQWARYFRGACLPVATPFSVEARIGQLPYGDFSVEADGIAAQPLVVTEATSAGPDEYLYAPVEEAFVTGTLDGNGLNGTIQGRFLNTCMQFKELRVIDSGKTVEVLPIIEMADRSDCEATETPFSRSFELPKDLSAGRHLMHVRSLNGKALNAMFSI